MGKVLVTYYSNSGNTKKMAERIAETVKCERLGKNVAALVKKLF